uniref:PFK domain-containing protein n=1 Tax=Caenorhabditis tropicalis TaxID=1561998 RepID=A0A1I7TRH5_9PELO
MSPDNYSFVGHQIGSKLAEMCEDFDIELHGNTESLINSPASGNRFSGIHGLKVDNSIGAQIGNELSKLCDKFDTQMMLGTSISIFTTVSRRFSWFSKLFSTLSRDILNSDNYF